MKGNTNDLATAELAQIESIKILKARYFRHLDLKDFEAFRALFTEDAMLWFEGVTPSWVDIEPAITMISAAVKNMTTIHHGHMPEIEITGPDSARAIWAMEDRFLVRGAEGGNWIERLHGFGHYHEEYMRHGDRWFIRRLKLCRLAVNRHEG